MENGKVEQAFNIEPMTYANTDDPNLDVRDWRGRYSPTLAGRRLEGIENHEQSLSLAFLPGGGGFILGTNWYVRHYDATGKLLWSSRVPSAFSVVATPDNRFAVVAIGDGTIRWIAMDTGRLLVKLFPTPDLQRWVAWTPSGYYMSSVGGDSLIGWQVDRGRDKTGDFFIAGRFSKQFLRPDIVTKTLALLDEERAIRAAAAESGRGGAIENVAKLLPPVIEILAPPSAISDTAITIHYRVRSDMDNPIQHIWAISDGRPLKLPTNALPGLDANGEAAGDFSLLVPARDSVLELYAENALGPVNGENRIKMAGNAKRASKSTQGRRFRRRHY